jgi:hypothetical protein
MLRVNQAALVEYSTVIPPLALVFELNPQSISRTKTMTVKTGNAPGTRGGYDFLSPSDTPRVSQGVTAQAETVTIEVLLDATDRMSKGHPIASLQGVQPEIDVLRAMIEPKAQGPAGVKVLASLGHGSRRAFQRNESASVLLFVWGDRVLPVFLTSVRVEEKAHLPSLVPYRASVTLSMQVIEGQNPFYMFEQMRTMARAALATGESALELTKRLFF